MLRKEVVPPPQHQQRIRSPLLFLLQFEPTRQVLRVTTMTMPLHLLYLRSQLLNQLSVRGRMPNLVEILSNLYLVPNRHRLLSRTARPAQSANLCHLHLLFLVTATTTNHHKNKANLRPCPLKPNRPHEGLRGAEAVSAVEPVVAFVEEGEEGIRLLPC